MSDLSSLLTLIVTFAGGATLLAADPGGYHQTTMPLVTEARYATSPGDILEASDGDDGRLYVKAHINGRSVRLLLDTAASATVLSRADAQRLNVKMTGRTRLLTVGGEVDAQVGLVDALIVGKRTLRGRRVIVANDIPYSLMGMDAIRALGHDAILL